MGGYSYMEMGDKLDVIFINLAVWTWNIQLLEATYSSSVATLFLDAQLANWQKVGSVWKSFFDELQSSELSRYLALSAAGQLADNLSTGRVCW